MSFYKVNTTDGKATSLKPYRYLKEGGVIISPQDMIANNPSIIMDIPELDLQSDQEVIVAYEYGLSGFGIDILFITANADIILIETKLFKNAESHRTVVAQAIDYAKALYNENIGDLFKKLSNNKMVNQEILSKFKKDDNWKADLEKNLRTGNFQVIIAGDRIHPNVLGMVESIQSAPHMSFTIFLVSLYSYELDDRSLIVSPTIEAKTHEIERSVIRIQIDHEKKDHVIESEIPEKDGKGSKPILSPDQYLGKLSNQEMAEATQKGWDMWKETGGDVKFGTSGFSMGITLGGKRVPLFYGYKDQFSILSDKVKIAADVPDEIHQEYKEELKGSPYIYDGYCIGNKVLVPHQGISVEELLLMFRAAVNLAKKLLNKDSE